MVIGITFLLKFYLLVCKLLNNPFLVKLQLKTKSENNIAKHVDVLVPIH